jgi:outer membrane protein insertion porin family
MKNALLAVLLLVLRVRASPFEPFVVRDIRVEGIQRTEAGTVFSYLPVKVGETMTEETAAAAIRSLCHGLFQGRTPGSGGRCPHRHGRERPAIAQIEITGNKNSTRKR